MRTPAFVFRLFRRRKVCQPHCRKMLCDREIRFIRNEPKPDALKETLDKFASERQDAVERVSGMSARFAGSQRVGDRRRRRLAVEADGAAEGPSPQQLSAPPGLNRAIDGPHRIVIGTAAKTSQESCFFPIAEIIPIERWKYFVAAVAVLAINGSLVALGQLSRKVAAWGGRQLADLFAPVQGPAIKWYSGLLIGLAAQLSFLIWWGRSRSSKDFEGRYWLWTQAAFAWLILSGCLALDAAQVAVDVLKHFQPTISAGWLPLAWVVPATVAALTVGNGLRREMRGCRASRVLISTAWFCYIAAAAICLGIASSFTLRSQLQLQQIALLTGHSALFFSMWVHARHVFHFSSDPAFVQKRTWRIPRPHFRLSQLWPFGRQARSEVALARSSPDGHANAPAEPIDRESDDGAETPRSRRAKMREESRFEANVVTQRKFDEQSVELNTDQPAELRELADFERLADQNAAQTTSPIPRADTSVSAKPHFRIDGGHAPVDLDALGQNADRGPNDQSPSEESFSDDEMELMTRPDMRGMSKKQRRRIMQELRNKERAARDS
jgi:hypothetical protein